MMYILKRLALISTTCLLLASCGTPTPPPPPLSPEEVESAAGVLLNSHGCIQQGLVKNPGLVSASIDNMHRNMLMRTTEEALQAAQKSLLTRYRVNPGSAFCRELDAQAIAYANAIRDRQIQQAQEAQRSAQINASLAEFNQSMANMHRPQFTSCMNHTGYPFCVTY